MLENSELSSLAFSLDYGGSGDGCGSLPRGFRGFCWGKRGGKGVQGFGPEMVVKAFSYYVLSYVDKMPLKRTSTSEAPAMTQATIRLVDSVATALETPAATMTNTDNANRNPEQRDAPIARNNCTEYCKVKFATGTLTKEALSRWNSFAQPVGIEEAYKITWVEFKKLLIKKYCPQTEIQKMEDEFYHLSVKGNDLKTYVRRF
nr:reverse transcriptase domain-containing protein [Tanacetum cinerariifolium]